MMVILHKLAYKLNSCLLGVIRYPIFKSFCISNMFFIVSVILIAIVIHPSFSAT